MPQALQVVDPGPKTGCDHPSTNPDPDPTLVTHSDLNRSPVCDVVVVPLEITLKRLKFAQIWDTAAWGSHGLQGGAVQLTSLGQGQPLLQKQQCWAQGQCIRMHLSHTSVTVAEQVVLRMESRDIPEPSPFPCSSGPGLVSQVLRGDQ